jgi:ubiquitin conjugation factor E4 B
LAQLPDWNPDYVTARSMEMLTILGPFMSRLSIFPDSDPNLPLQYFGSSGYVMDGTYDAVTGVGGRNHADVKSAQKALRDLSTSVQV